MDQITLKITGESALLMHSDILSNPLNPLTKEHKKLTDKRKKTSEDHAEIAKSEWTSSLYYDKGIGLYMPSQNLMSSIRGGGKISRLGAAIGRAVLCLDDKLALSTSAPKSIEKMWESQKYTDARSVVISGRRIMRYRPRFDEWSLTMTLQFSPDVIDRDQLLTSAKNAGKLIGLGDFRPEKSGLFGRYSVEDIA